MIQPIEAAPLTTAESDEFTQCEAIIHGGLQTFEEVGHAFLRIRDGRLYRLTHGTFASYCSERWRLGVRRAYQLMEAAEVAANVNQGSQTPITSERQARELGRLPARQHAEVWAEVVQMAEAGGITAAQVKQSVERRLVVKEGRSGQHPTPPLPAGTYSVLYADPPWQYDFSNFSGKVAENHYHTMADEDICALPVRDIAAKHSVLFLWATAPKLLSAIRVMTAWGFDYKSQWIWHKSGKGLGYWGRIDHELLLIGTRGQPGCPPVLERETSVVAAKKTAHSVKPAEFRTRIERSFPDAARVELYARGTPPAGWEFWGQEVTDMETFAMGFRRG